MNIKHLFKRQDKVFPFISKKVFIVSQNEKGQVTFLALLFSLMLISYFFFVILKCQRTHLEIKDRLQTYACYHYLDARTDDYIHKMSFLNKGILAAHLAMLIPATAPTAKATHEALMGMQQVLHFSYLKNFLPNQHCHVLQTLSYAKNLPYKSSGLLLTRLPDGTVILNKREWEIWVPSKTDFALKGIYKLKDAFSSQSSLETIEVKLSLKG